MRHFIFLATVVCVFFSIASCVKDRTFTQDADVPLISICNSIEPVNISIPDKPFDIYEIVDSVRIIFTETSDSCLLGSIDYAKYTMDGIVVVDRHISQGVYLFDNNGYYVRKFGRRGNGSGEYTSISGYSIADTSVSITDGMTWKYLKYDRTGNLQHSLIIENFPSYGIIPSKSGWDIYHYGESNDRNYCLSFHNDLSKEVKYAFKVRRPVFQRMSEVSESDDGSLMFKYKQSDTVYFVSDSLIYSKYVIPIHNYDTRKYLKELSKMSSKQRLIMENSISNTKCLDGKFFESNNWCMLTYRQGSNCYALLYDRFLKTSYLGIIGFLDSSFQMDWIMPGYPVQLQHDKLMFAMDAQVYSDMSKESKDKLFLMLSDSDSIRLTERFKENNENPVICVFALKR